MVWQRAPVSSSDIVEALSVRRKWTSRTIRTLMDRLIRKKAIGPHPDGGRPSLYRALVSREDCVRRESRSFMERVFGGDSDPMLVHFVENTRLSAETIARLRKILNGRKP